MDERHTFLEKKYGVDLERLCVVRGDSSRENMIRRALRQQHLSSLSLCLSPLSHSRAEMNRMHYKETVCRVTSSQLLHRTCKRSQCTSGTTKSSKSCRTVYYSCWKPIWNVEYSVEVRSYSRTESLLSHSLSLPLTHTYTRTYLLD